MAIDPLITSKVIRRILLVVGISVSVLLFLPVIQVLWFRFMNPSATMPMILRRVESGIYGLGKKPASYNWLSDDKLPPGFVKQACLTEDSQFYHHRGFDWKQIKASIREARRTGEPARGASTITQQCARSLFLWQSRSWSRKGLEAYYTFWMETFLSKQRIMELYLNVIELGEGIYGVEAAAQHYYNIQAEQLTKEQCAMFIAMMPQPRQMNPLFPSQSLKKRQANILVRYRRAYPSQFLTVTHTDDVTCKFCDQIVSSCSDKIKEWFYFERERDSHLHASAGYRGKEKQEEALRKGASKAQFGQSPHNYTPSRAVDVWFSEDGQAVWDSPKLKEMAERMPAEFEWGGNWKDFIDAPHFQERDWKAAVTNYPNGN